jgi:hypothetical protein
MSRAAACRAPMIRPLFFLDPRKSVSRVVCKGADQSVLVAYSPGYSIFLSSFLLPRVMPHTTQRNDEDTSWARPLRVLGAFSNRGQPIILCNRYYMYMHKRSANGKYQLWRCREHRRLLCRGRAVSSILEGGEITWVLIETAAHNHSPPPGGTDPSKKPLFIESGAARRSKMASSSAKTTDTSYSHDSFTHPVAQ